MAKAPSTETQLRTAKRRIAELEREVSGLSAQYATMRGRATKAEQEAAEWKARFDVLLRRDGKEVNP
jgi:multidrug resistance efflux pump